MADLEPLIRYRKYQLDEKQRFLARLYQDAERLLTRKEGMLDQIQREKELTDADVQPQMIVTFLSYVERMQEQIALLDIEIQRVETRIEIAIDDMRESFAELKKVEITHQRRLDEKKAELMKREEAMFSEIALQQYVDKLKKGDG